jgi:mRNA interferase MazF
VRAMTPGDVVLTRLPQFAGGAPKLRPALLLASLPGPYQTQLVCGISPQLHHQQPHGDELIQPAPR